MSIVAAAVVPHSPLLLPTVAKEHAALFSKTQEAALIVGQNVYAAQPDCVVILTPHGELLDDAAVLHVAEKYSGGFTTFGDFSTSVSAPGSPSIAHRLKDVAEREHVSLHLQTHEELDYGTSIPVHTALQQLPNTPILPVLLGGMSIAHTLRLGQLLYEFGASSTTRIALIASADLTRRKVSMTTLTKPSSEEKLLSQAIMSVDPSMLASATPQQDTCGFSPIVALLAALQQQHPKAEILNFEAPMGVGLLTAYLHCSS